MKAIHYWLIGLLLIPVLSAAAANVSPGNTPVKEHGQLSVKDGRIVNQQGVPPQLRGLSFSWSIWQGEKYYNPSVVDWIIRDFKVDLIRLSMAIEPKGGYLDNEAVQKEKITALVDHALKRGIYVIIDWHDHHADKNVKAAKKFFSEMAERYQGHPNVIYEIWNEPEEHAWEVIKTYSEEVIPVIRKHDSKNLIIVGSPRWDQNVDVTAQDPITAFNNLAYSFHFYASDPNHQDLLKQRAERAMEAGLPLFVTEWGVGESNGDGVFDRQKTDSWVEWMEKHELSWANWNITDKDETTALLTPGAPADGKWKQSDLSENGQYMRDLLRRLND